MTQERPSLPYVLIDDGKEGEISDKLTGYDQFGLPFLQEFDLDERLNRPVVIVRANGDFVWWGPDDKIFLAVYRGAADDLERSVRQIRLQTRNAKGGGLVPPPIAIVHQGLETNFYVIAHEAGYEPVKVTNFLGLYH